MLSHDQCDYMYMCFVVRNGGVDVLSLLKYRLPVFDGKFSKMTSKIISIHLEYEIEKSVPRITDWHHDACRVMTIGDREGRIFLSHSRINNGYFSCSPLNTSFYIRKT